MGEGQHAQTGLRHLLLRRQQARDLRQVGAGVGAGAGTGAPGVGATASGSEAAGASALSAAIAGALLGPVLGWFVDRFGAKASLASRAKSKEKQIERLQEVAVESPEVDLKKIHFRFPQPPRLPARSKCLSCRAA